MSADETGFKHRDNDLTVEFHVPDFALAKQFYGQLGFTVRYEEAPGLMDSGFMVLERANTRLQFTGGDQRIYKHSYFKKFPKDSVPGFHVEVVIPVSDISELYAQVQKNVPQALVEKLKKRSWGCQDFRVADPFGFYLRFTS